MPPKAKPDTAAYQKLKKDIKEGTIGIVANINILPQRNGGVQPPHPQWKGV